MSPDLTPAALQALAETLGLEEDALDETVYDCKAEEASAINNQGLAAQVEYLCDCLGPAAVARLLRDRAAR